MGNYQNPDSNRDLQGRPISYATTEMNQSELDSTTQAGSIDIGSPHSVLSPGGKSLKMSTSDYNEVVPPGRMNIEHTPLITMPEASPRRAYNRHDRGSLDL